VSRVLPGRAPPSANAAAGRYDPRVTAGDPEQEAPREERRQERLRVLDLSAVGLAFPIALLLGYFAGRTIGDWLGSAQIGGLVGALFGIVGGFYNLFKMVARLAPRSGAPGETRNPEPPE